MVWKKDWPSVDCQNLHDIIEYGEPWYSFSVHKKLVNALDRVLKLLYRYLIMGLVAWARWGDGLSLYYLASELRWISRWELCDTVPSSIVSFNTNGPLRYSPSNINGVMVYSLIANGVVVVVVVGRETSKWGRHRWASGHGILLDAFGFR